jgi:hypothetical protein
MMVYNPEQVITLKYTNWKNETAIRRVVPIRTYFGTNSFHPGRHWLLEVYDVEKEDQRTYLLSACDFTTHTL